MKKDQRTKTLPLTAAVVPASALRSRHSGENSDASNMLRIDGPGFSMRLEGDAEFLEYAYKTMRHEILRRLTKAQDDQQQHLIGKTVSTTPGDSQEPSIHETAPSPGHIWICVSHELYHKIHVTSRSLLQQSILGSVIDTERLHRVYIARKQRDEMKEILQLGQALWSELTPEGRQRLGANFSL